MQVCAKIKVMKKAVFVILVLALLFAINNAARSIYDLWHKQDLLISAQKQLEKEKAENAKLKSQISYAQSNQFIEEEARNKLFMGKPGDQQVIIPQGLLKSKEEKKTVDLRPNWQKWWDLFFKD